MTMGSKIMYYVWDGGSGTNDQQVTIGYCKESPKEVLTKLIRTHCINSYKEILWRTVEEYPANLSGLMIYPVDDKTMKGISITGFLSELMNEKLMKQSEWSEFSIEKFCNSITKRHELVERLPYKVKYREIVKDWEAVFSTCKLYY